MAGFFEDFATGMTSGVRTGIALGDAYRKSQQDDATEEALAIASELMSWDPDQVTGLPEEGAPNPAQFVSDAYSRLGAAAAKTGDADFYFSTHQKVRDHLKTRYGEAVASAMATIDIDPESTVAALRRAAAYSGSAEPPQITAVALPEGSPEPFAYFYRGMVPGSGRQISQAITRQQLRALLAAATPETMLAYTLKQDDFQLRENEAKANAAYREKMLAQGDARIGLEGRQTDLAERRDARAEAAAERDMGLRDLEWALRVTANASAATEQFRTQVASEVDAAIAGLYPVSTVEREITTATATGEEKVTGSSSSDPLKGQRQTASLLAQTIVDYNSTYPEEAEQAFGALPERRVEPAVAARLSTELALARAENRAPGYPVIRADGNEVVFNVDGYQVPVSRALLAGLASAK